MQLVLAGLVLVAMSAPVAAAVAQECDAVSADARSAAQEAAACGQAVEDLSRRSEVSQAVVNPDGTVTVNEFVEPQWVRHGDGGWSDVDTTLRLVDGVVTPVATAVPVEFSAGGSGPLARMQYAGQDLVMSWPAPLPAPTLSGDTATYENVLSDVDLQVTATSVGFSEVLVVKTQEALSDPSLAEIDFDTSGSTVAIVPTADGGAAARSARGSVVFRSPAPLMWDSSGGDSGPGPGAQSAAIGLETDGTRLMVTPDAAMMADTAELEFPVYIDPSWSPDDQLLGWKNVASRSDVVDSPSFTLTNGSVKGDAGAGETCDSSSNGDCTSTPYKVRSLFRMKLPSFTNLHVLSAKFRITQKWSWTCNPGSSAKLWVVGTWSSSTTWNHQPTWGVQGLFAEVAGNHREDSGAGCSGTGVDEFTVTSFVLAAQSGHWPNLSVGLRAIHENTNDEWKRFDSSTAKLSITYNTIPGIPANLSPDQGTVACGGVVGTDSPQLRAQYVDADSGDTLSATFEWQQLPSGTVTDVSGPSEPRNTFGSVTLNLGSGAEGHSYQFRVQTNDGHDLSPWSGWCQFTVDATAPPEPDVTPVASGGAPVYSPCDPAEIDACAVAGGPGVAGAFQFSEPDDPAGQDVVSYAYGWDSPSMTVTVPAGAASPPILLTPPRYGINTLQVQGSDAGGHSSPTRMFQFLVGGPSEPLAQWLLDDIAGHDFHDQKSGGALSATGVTWTDDARYVGVKAATFDTGSEATQTVAGLDTAGSFSVSAWVRLASTSCSGDQTAVGVDGDATAGSSHVSGFMLGYDCADQRWRMRVADRNMAAPAFADATGPGGGVVAGRWTLLVGVWDENPAQVRLWVDGVLVSTVAPSPSFLSSRNSGWTATGPVTVGRDRLDDADDDYLMGQVADVRVWNRVIVAQDVAGTDADPAVGVPAQAALGTPLQVGEWDFTDGMCFCASSVDVKFGRALTLVPDWVVDPDWGGDPDTTSAWFVDIGHDGNGALRLDGVAGSASTADDSGTLDTGDDVQHPVLRTDQSVSVSVWVDVPALTGVDQVVL
ncbi:MAG TPA: LamG-like jellyroll fold domain-containing protein, partial [Micromonosporaceae bacterium]